MAPALLSSAPMTPHLAPYRVAPLCPQHMPSHVPACPRCAEEWLGRAPPPESFVGRGVARKTFLAGLCAATVFGAVIGTAIGFVAGASPLYAAVSSPPMHARRTPPPRPRAAAPAPLPRPPQNRGVGTVALPSPRVEAPVAALTPLLAKVGQHTSDPELLLARLQGLARSGVPVIIETRRLSPAAREAALQAGSGLAASLRILPAERAGRVLGMRIFGIRPGGAVSEAGVRNGDVLLAVNGIDLAADRWPSAQPFPGDARAALVELVRGDEQRVIVVRW